MRINIDNIEMEHNDDLIEGKLLCFVIKLQDGPFQTLEKAEQYLKEITILCEQWIYCMKKQNNSSKYT